MVAREKSGPFPERVSFARTPIQPMPGLIQVQRDSFERFKKEGLRELFSEISPETMERQNVRGRRSRKGLR